MLRLSSLYLREAVRGLDKEDRIGGQVLLV